MSIAMPAVITTQEGGRAAPWIVASAGVVALVLTAVDAVALPDARTGRPVTFYRDVTPLVWQHCGGCHHPNGSAPFSLLTHDEVRNRASQISEVTASRYMPPWLPEPGYGEFAGQRRLTEAQIDQIADWTGQGSQEGNSDDATHPPKFPDGWQLGEPDLVATMPAGYQLLAEGQNVFRNFVIPISLTRRQYVKAIEFQPGNPKIVHHLVLNVDRTQTARQREPLDPELGFSGMDVGQATSP